MSADIGDKYSRYVDENWIISIPSNYVPNEKGFGDLLFKSMKKFRDRKAQYIANTNEEDTYGELLERCVRASLHLRQQYDLKKDDIVMLCSNNHKNSCVPYLASIFLGIQVASLDPTLSALDMTHFLKVVQPRLLFVVPEALNVVEESLSDTGISTEIVVFGHSEKYKSFNDFLKPHKDEQIFIPVVKSLNDPLIIVFSSGTSGLPKGIVLSHYSIGAQTNTWIQRVLASPVSLVNSTLYWISGILYLTSSIVMGWARVFCPYDPKKLWHVIEKYKVSSTFISPTQAIGMIDNHTDAVDTSSVRLFATAGAPISEFHLQKLRDLLPGAFVVQCYGQTEAGTLAILDINDPLETSMLYHKLSSIGTPIQGMTYKVVDLESGGTCGPNKPGELRLKSKLIMSGYYKKDSSETFDSDGWLRTGDIVYFDEDFCFYLVDRVKQMLKYKAWHVPPAMIEMILLEHPAVKQAVVIGKPHPEDGDHPTAIIVPSDNYKNKISKEEIENFITQRVPDRMKLRGGVKFLDSLPMTPSGKMKRGAIKDMVLTGQI